MHNNSLFSAVEYIFADAEYIFADAEYVFTDGELRIYAEQMIFSC